MQQKVEIEPGIYFGLDEAEYHSAAGLSNSGMKQLAVSPLSYWHNSLNPEREAPEVSPAMRWGTAVHCRLLEPEQFSEAYAVTAGTPCASDSAVASSDIETVTSSAYPSNGSRNR